MPTTMDLEGLELTIGPVAKLAGCSVSWVRRLEEAGVIPQAARTSTGRRVYRLADVATIRDRLAAGRERAPASDEAA